MPGVINMDEGRGAVLNMNLHKLDNGTPLSRQSLGDCEQPREKSIKY
jgi:hypothetical protein